MTCAIIYKSPLGSTTVILIIKKSSTTLTLVRPLTTTKSLIIRADSFTTVFFYGTTSMKRATSPKPMEAKNPACTCTMPAPLVLAVLVVAASPGLLELTLVLGLEEVLVMVTMVESLVITTCGFWAVPS